jgi:probable phosphoglycerate mutase
VPAYPLLPARSAEVFPERSSRIDIWLVRHGATEWSVAGRHTGSSDLPLLPEGAQQARALSGRLTGRPFARVLTSPMQRARETARIAGFGNVVEITELLREWN